MRGRKQTAGKLALLSVIVEIYPREGTETLIFEGIRDAAKVEIYPCEGTETYQYAAY